MTNDRRNSQRASKADRLAAAARAAADVRAFDTNPDVVAYRIERLRGRVDRLIWTGLVLGLLFTMANVQHFAAQGAPTWSIPWVIAWLLDPMVSLVLVGVLLGEQVIARYQLKAGPWARRTKWTALTLTYAMNTWSAWSVLEPALILLHSVPPIIVFCAAEAVTDLRYWITEAVKVAHSIVAAAEPYTVDIVPTLSEPVEQVREELAAELADLRRGLEERDRAVRKLDHLAVDRADLAGAGGSRSGDLAEDLADRPTAPSDQAAYRAAVIAELRDEYREAIARGEKFEVTWRDVHRRTGYSQRWSEGVLAEARRGLISTRSGAALDLAEDSADRMVADLAVAPSGSVRDLAEVPA